MLNTLSVARGAATAIRLSATKRSALLSRSRRAARRRNASIASPRANDEAAESTLGTGDGRATAGVATRAALPGAAMVPAAELQVCARWPRRRAAATPAKAITAAAAAIVATNGARPRTRATLAEMRADRRAASACCSSRRHSSANQSIIDVRPMGRTAFRTVPAAENPKQRRRGKAARSQPNAASPSADRNACSGASITRRISATGRRSIFVNATTTGTFNSVADAASRSAISWRSTGRRSGADTAPGTGASNNHRIASAVLPAASVRRASGLAGSAASSPRGSRTVNSAVCERRRPW